MGQTVSKGPTPKLMLIINIVHQALYFQKIGIVYSMVNMLHNSDKVNSWNHKYYMATAMFYEFNRILSTYLNSLAVIKSSQDEDQFW